LNCGFDTFQKLDDTADEHLDALLETIMALEKETGKRCEADIITWRGMMTKVSRSSLSFHLESDFL
jgi:RAT1-interacting protein